SPPAPLTTMSDPTTRRFLAKADRCFAGDRPSARATTGSAPRPRTRARTHDLALAATFTATVVRYLTTVLPVVTRELRHWHAQASAIPDPTLRANALEALGKRGNMEGAALFAVLAPRSHRRLSVRALVAFQTAYNYLDMLAEQPSADPVANGAQL